MAIIDPFAIADNYPYLKSNLQDTIFVTEDEYHLLNDSQTIDIDGPVSIEFLRKILTDSTYYSYTKRFLNGETTQFKVSYITNGDTKGAIFYTRYQIIDGLSRLLIENREPVSLEQHRRYMALKELVTFEKLVSLYKDQTHQVSIDGINYAIPCEQILKLIQVSPTDFKRVLQSSKITEILGIPKEHFIYACVDFLRNVKNDYYLSSEVLANYESMTSCQYLDIQALNTHLTIEDTLHSQITIHPELRSAILDGLPQTASNLEKATYIYIKMCKILTYDSEYYAMNFQNRVVLLKHSNIATIANITPTNNQVVCFEFNLIFARLLSELGLKFATNYRDADESHYGLAHSSLEFRADKFLVVADAVTGILGGDLLRAKINRQLVGFKCLNSNPETQKEFQKAIYDMFNLINSQEQAKELPPSRQEFNEVLAAYENTTKNILDIPLLERLSILIARINASFVVDIDYVSYALILRKMLFSDQEMNDNIFIKIIRNNVPTDANRLAMSSAVIAFNPIGFQSSPDKTTYYYFSTNWGFTPISKSELEAKFTNHELEYLDKGSTTIPNINPGGMQL